MQTYPTNYAIRRLIADQYRDGVSGVTTSGTDSTSLLDTSRVETADLWNGSEATIGNVATTNAWVSRLITDGIVGDLTTAAFPNTIASASPYEILQRFRKIQYDSAIKAAVDFARGAHWIEWIWDTLTPVASTYDYAIPQEHEVTTVTADAGSSTTALVDSATTQANDYWNFARMVGLSGANAGKTNFHTDWTFSTKTFAFDNAWPSTISAGDTFHLIRFLPNYIYLIEYIPSGGTYPVPMDHRDWGIVWRGQPYIRFYRVPPIGATVRVYGIREPLLPSHDMHPVEIPQDVAVSYGRYKLQLSMPRRVDLKMDDDVTGRPELFRAAQLALSRHRYQRPTFAKRVH